MGTLIALLNLSQGALQASQAAIDITSNNVANANTPGYTTEVATWQENDSVALSPTERVGEGASVTTVSQRDTVLNHRVQQQTQLEASSAAENTALSALQSIFGLTSSSTSTVSTAIGSSMNSFFNSLSSLEANPSDSSTRQSVLSAAASMASAFNGAANQISQQTAGLNQQVSTITTQINSLTRSIAALNLQIESTSPTSDAGTLEDQRQQDLTQLSRYIGFDQTRTENNGLTLTTANGVPLVSEGQSFSLTNSIQSGNTEILSSTGHDITFAVTGGSLGGMLQARDRDLPQVASALDSLAYSIGTAVNTQNAAGLDANGNPGGAIFTLPAAAAGSAASISVAATGPASIAAAAVGQGASGNANATALNALANSMLAGGQTASEFYSSLLTQVGGTAAAVSEDNTTQQASLAQLMTQQSSQSSVSLDQEAANLTLYERSYAAAAKVFTVVDQLMATALNLGEETAVT